jgi:hypothetical protein
VLKAWKEVPALYNQACVTEALLEVLPDRQADRDTAVMSNAISRERDRNVHIDNAQNILNARRNRRRPVVFEELGPDWLTDEQDEYKERRI